MTHNCVLYHPELLAEISHCLPVKELHLLSATAKTQQYSPVLMRFQLMHLRRYSRRQTTTIRRAMDEVISALQYIQERTTAIARLQTQLQATWDWARQQLRHRTLMRVAEVMFPAGSQWRPEGTIEV